MKQLEDFSRNLLCCGSAIKSTKHSVAWLVVSLSSAEGGLNLKVFGKWDQTALLKQLWVVDLMRDRLWICWVHAYYIKTTLVGWAGTYGCVMDVQKDFLDEEYSYSKVTVGLRSVLVICSI